MTNIKVSMIGTGSIARMLSKTIRALDGVELYAVMSRTQEKADIFAEENGFLKAYSSLDEMLMDQDTELVYIATPHSSHYQYTKKCLEYKKHVLCEKPFTVNAKQAEELILLAKENKVFLSEAMWTRFQPFAKTLEQILKSNVIGKATLLVTNFGDNIAYLERMKNPMLAGGALLDLGIYPLTLASMVFGDKIEAVTSSAVLTNQGVDAKNSMILTYADGKMAVITSAMDVVLDSNAVIYGEKGFIEIDRVCCFEQIRVFDQKQKLIKTYERPEQITGYEYEILAAVKAIHMGKLECDEIPHDTTLHMMKLMDQLRESWNMKYPFE